VSPLHGRGIVVTRPARQSANLVSLIEEAGGRAVRFPAIEIEPFSSPALDSVIGRLEGYDLAVFISRNAVEQGLARVRRDAAWPAALRAAAVGSGTRRALAGEGIDGAIAPEGEADSEALLGHPAMKSLKGKRVVVFRGSGGREQLAEGLRSRGALVDYAECYRRIRPAADSRPLLEEFRRGAIDAFTVSSAEGLNNLSILLGDQAPGLLRGTPMFVPHPRVAEAARAMGVEHLAVAGAGDEEMLAALVAYFRPAG
jgi:uroporphyrinogen-III synthase